MSTHVTHGRDNADWLTVGEVGTLLRVHPRTIRRMIDRGDLPATRVGVQLRIHPQRLAAWLDERGEVR
jgi:excisionase family DNA binding protein